MKVNITDGNFNDWIKNNMNHRTLCLGIVCITILEIIALLKGFNGTLLKSVIAVIALGVGIIIPTPKILKR